MSHTSNVDAVCVCECVCEIFHAQLIRCDDAVYVCVMVLNVGVYVDDGYSMLMSSVCVFDECYRCVIMCDGSVHRSIFVSSYMCFKHLFFTRLFDDEIILLLSLLMLICYMCLYE